MTFHLFQFCNVIAKKQLKGRGDTPLPNPPWLFGGGGTPPLPNPPWLFGGFFGDNIMWVFLVGFF